MSKEDVIKIASSLKSYDVMYDLLKVGDFSFLNRKCGTIEYPEIEWCMYDKDNEYIGKFAWGNDSPKYDKYAIWNARDHIATGGHFNDKREAK